MTSGLFIREDAYALRRRALELHLRRRGRHACPSRAPQRGFWQQPVGAVVTVVLFVLFFAAMIACVLVVGSGQGGN